MPLDKLIELWREYDTVVPKEEILRVLKLRDQLLDALQAKNKKAFLRWMSEGDDPERHYKGTEISCIVSASIFSSTSVLFTGNYRLEGTNKSFAELIFIAPKAWGGV